MTKTASIWSKYAVIADIVKHSPRGLGRTALQKLIYLLQVLYNVDSGYEFCFYTYGPFSSEILSDIESLEHYNVLKITRVSYPGGYDGYEIKAADDLDKVLDISKDFVRGCGDAIQELTSCFGDKTAEQLELYATIVWVNRKLPQADNKDRIINTVHELKPKFNSDEIATGIEFMNSHNFLQYQR